MRKAWAALFVAAFACKSGKGTQNEGSALSNEKHLLGLANVPVIKTAGVFIAEPANPPPVLVIVSAAGAITVNAAQTWDAIAKMDLDAGAHPAERKMLHMALEEGAELGQTPSTIVASFERAPGEVDVDLASLEDTSTTTGGQDDPPPPPEEDMDEDGPEESGGTGTAITLDEGKMGKKDSDRAEGQYKMQKADDPQFQKAQRERDERIRARAGLHKVGGYRGPGTKYNGYAGVERASAVVGEVAREGKLEAGQPGVVLAAPHTKATAMIDAVTASEGLIAVATDKGVRPLRTQFVRDRDGRGEPRKWIELHVGVSTLAFEAVPDVPVPVASLDRAAVAGALDKVRTGRHLDARAPIDVLVDPDVDTQRLVDVLVALDQADATMIGLGVAPAAGTAAAKQRGARRPAIVPMRMMAQGDLDKAEIRKLVAEQAAGLQACYAKALAATPDLAGAITVQFFISPVGKVTAAAPIGGDAAVATCVTNVIKAIKFPKPRGGGGVQVMYPFGLEP